MPYRRSKGRHLPQGWGSRGWSRLQRERPEAGARPESLGWLGSRGLKKGEQGAGLPRQASSGSGPDSAEDAQGGVQSSGPPLLSPWKVAGESVVQICGLLSYGGRLCPKGNLEVHPLHLLGLHHHPQYSRFS